MVCLSYSLALVPVVAFVLAAFALMALLCGSLTV